MQDTFGVIMLALVDGEPRVLNLKQVLEYYVEHQKDVIVRRTKFELEKAKKRAHILEGLIIALDNIDEIVNLIRSSADAASARAALIGRFGLTEIQAQAIPRYAPAETGPALNAIRSKRSTRKCRNASLIIIPCFPRHRWSSILSRRT